MKSWKIALKWYVCYECNYKLINQTRVPVKTAYIFEVGEQNKYYYFN